MRKFVELNKKVLKDKRCKQCKELFTPRSSLQYICCTQCALNYKSAMNWKKEKSKMKLNAYEKDYKKSLQDEINKLSKIIDVNLGHTNCIDCGLYLDKEKNQIDACHFISRKKNPTLRYNLHNLHSGHNHCNVYNENHESNYKEGLINRYGISYIELIDNLPIKYKEIKLTSLDIVEKLKIVRKLIRNFDTFKFTDSVNARKTLNIIIGIYN
jgi:hypothetical protein